MVVRHDPQRPPARQQPVTSATVEAPPAIAAWMTELVTLSQWQITTGRPPRPTGPPNPLSQSSGERRIPPDGPPG